MTNIVALRTPQKKDHPDQGILATQSPLLFTAYERPLWYEGKKGDKFDNTNHKALVRMINDKPVCLNVVRNTYKVVQNAELFDAINEGINAGLGKDANHNADVIDKVSYNGTQCFREYRFRDIQVRSPEQDDIAFRIIIQNGFGSGSIKLYAGAIDFFCTNGMILGDYTRTYAKHTSSVQVSKFKEAVEMAVDLFWKNKHMYAALADQKVLNDDLVQEWYEDKFGERLGARLMHQYLIEKKQRGPTLWAVYSALTYYSSHDTGDFGLRSTGNDHVAATMVKREVSVQRAVSHASLMEIAA